MVALSFSHIEGGPKTFPHFKRGGRRIFFSHAEGGGGTKSLGVVFMW